MWAILISQGPSRIAGNSEWTGQCCSLDVLARHYPLDILWGGRVMVIVHFSNESKYWSAKPSNHLWAYYLLSESGYLDTERTFNILTCVSFLTHSRIMKQCDKINKVRVCIYEGNYTVDNDEVKDQSLTPTAVDRSSITLTLIDRVNPESTFSELLGPLGFNIFTPLWCRLGRGPMHWSHKIRSPPRCIQSTDESAECQAFMLTIWEVVSFVHREMAFI